MAACLSQVLNKEQQFQFFWRFIFLDLPRLFLILYKRCMEQFTLFLDHRNCYEQSHDILYKEVALTPLGKKMVFCLKNILELQLRVCRSVNSMKSPFQFGVAYWDISTPKSKAYWFYSKLDTLIAVRVQTLVLEQNDAFVTSYLATYSQLYIIFQKMII